VHLAFRQRWPRSQHGNGRVRGMCGKLGRVSDRSANCIPDFPAGSSAAAVGIQLRKFARSWLPRRAKLNRPCCGWGRRQPVPLGVA